MPPLHLRLSTEMRALTRLALAHPAGCLAVVGFLTLLMATGLVQLELRTDGVALHPEGNAVIERSNVDRKRFVEHEQVILLLSALPGGPAVETRQGLELLRELHASLANVRGVSRWPARSFANLLDPQEGQHLLLVREFLHEIPEDPEALRALLVRAHASRVADGLYLSPNGRAAAIYIPLAEGHPRKELVAELERWVADRQTPDFELRLMGPAIAETTLGDTVFRDLAWLVPGMVFTIACLLYLSLRSIGGVLLPMAEVLVVLIWTLGAMGHLGVPVTLVTTILPVVLMTLAVTDEIHLLERLQARLAGLAPETQEVAGYLESRQTRCAIEGAIDDVARPIILTSLTTAVGLLSFTTATMSPIRNFGVFAAVGILLAMILSFSFIPALASLLPRTWLERKTSSDSTRERDQVLPHERLLLRRPGAAALVVLGILLVAVPGFWKLTVQDAWVDNFDPNSDLVSGERDYNEHFWGSYRFDVVITSEQADFFQTLDGHRAMETLRQIARDGPHVGGVLTHLVPYEVIMQIEGMGERASELSREHLDRANKLVEMVSHRVALEQVRIRQRPVVRMRLYIPSSDYRKGVELQEYLERELPARPEGHELDYSFSGDLPIATEIVRAIVQNQLRSLGLAIASVAALLLLSLRSLKRTLIVLAPVVSTLVILFGGLGHAGIALGIATSMFAALTIGVGVDFGLHLTHAHERARQRGASLEAAGAQMMASTGRAIRWNASVLALGFLVLTFSALQPNRLLGLVLAAAMCVSYLTSMLLMPWLLSRRSQ